MSNAKKQRGGIPPKRHHLFKGWFEHDHPGLPALPGVLLILAFVFGGSQWAGTALVWMMLLALFVGLPVWLLLSLVANRRR